MPFNIQRGLVGAAGAVAETAGRIEEARFKDRHARAMMRLKEEYGKQRREETFQQQRQLAEEAGERRATEAGEEREFKLAAEKRKYKQREKEATTKFGRDKELAKLRRGGDATDLIKEVEYLKTNLKDLPKFQGLSDAELTQAALIQRNIKKQKSPKETRQDIYMEAINEFSRLQFEGLLPEDMTAEEYAEQSLDIFDRKFGEKGPKVAPKGGKDYSSLWR